MVWDNSTIIIASLDGLEEGIYEIALFIYDLGGNVNSHIVSVTVKGASPVINHPSDLSFNEGITGNTISWIANDEHPSNYEILSNSSNPIYNFSCLWIDDTPIEISFDGLLSGIYSFTITVYDVVGNFVSDTVIVKVLDVIKPLLKLETGSTKFVEGSSNNFIEWHLIDNNPGEYKIYVNGEIEVPPTPWNNNTIIRYDFDELQTGDYNITIVITDIWKNENINSVFITINSNDTSPFYLKPSFYLILAFLIIYVNIFGRFILSFYREKASEKLRSLAALAEIKGLLSIQMFAIIIPGGVPIYQEKFESSGLDPTLLGGLTTAISAFMNQIVPISEADELAYSGPSDVSSNFEIMDKQGLSITSHKSSNSTILIVSNNKLPNVIYDQIYNVHIKMDEIFGNYFIKSSNILSDLLIYPIFEEVGLKLKMINHLEINFDELYKIKEHPSLTQELQYGISLLKEFFDSNYVETEEFQISKIMEFYKQKGYTDTKAADFLVFAYDLNIIN